MLFVIQSTIRSSQNVLGKLPLFTNNTMNLKIAQISAISLNSRAYAEAPKKTAKMSATSGGRVKEFPVESDTHKLQTYCCGSNIFIEGEDVKLKPESEYPDWLWTLHTGLPKTLEELDPNTKEYWLKVRVLARRKKNQLHRFRVKVMKKF